MLKGRFVLMQKIRRRLAGQTAVSLFPPLRDLLGKRGVVRGTFVFARFGAGFFLSQAVVLNGYAPFGVGWVAAGGAGLTGLAGLLGSLLGYAFFWSLAEGLKYMAISILVFASLLILQDTTLAQKPFFRPFVCLTCSGFVGIVFVASDGFAPLAVLFFVTELLLIAGSGYFFHMALSTTQQGADDVNPPRSLRRVFGWLLLIACLILALSQFTLWGQLSPARAAALLLILLLARQEGLGAGSCAGLAIGAALDLGGGHPFFSMCYGLSGLMGGLFYRAHRLLSISVCVLTTALAVLWTGDGALRLSVLLESFVASVLFMLFPDRPLFHFIAKSQTPDDPLWKHRLRDQSVQRLRRTADSFRDLYGSLSGAATAPQNYNDENIATIFDRTADKVCKTCALSSLCWDRESYSTYQALSDTASVMLEKGHLESADFPAYFSSRCLHFEKFLSAANNELVALLYRRQYARRMQESRTQVCRQYAELSQILEQEASLLTAPYTFDWGSEKKLAAYLEAKQVEARVAVFSGTDERLHVEIAGSDLSALTQNRTKTLHDLTTLLDRALGEPEHRRSPSGESLTLLEAEPYIATLGVAAHKKEGQPVSGDCMTYFKTESGLFYILLADGMGSGEEACRESVRATRLLERFLRAGVSPETALRTLNAALILQNAQEPGFVTLDLLAINLLKGELIFYKYGAAPSYLKKGRAITRVVGSALPAGLNPEEPSFPLDVTRLPVSAGECILLCSDGVADPAGDEWLQDLFAAWEDGLPKDLARRVLREGVVQRGRQDDMTVIAICLEKQKQRRARQAG